jgi:hypothetical protein
MDTIKTILGRKWQRIKLVYYYSGNRNELPLLFSDFQGYLNNTLSLKNIVEKLTKTEMIPNYFFKKDFNILNEKSKKQKEEDPIIYEDFYREDLFLIGRIYTSLLNEIDMLNLSEGSKEKTSDINEEIKLQSLGISIKDNYMTKSSKKKKLNPTDKALVYFLYYELKNNKEDRCFELDVLAEKLKTTEGNIKNRISVINTEVKNLVSGGQKTNIYDFIKYERGRGYHLNPKILI